MRVFEDKHSSQFSRMFDGDGRIFGFQFDVFSWSKLMFCYMSSRPLSPRRDEYIPIPTCTSLYHYLYFILTASKLYVDDVQITHLPNMGMLNSYVAVLDSNPHNEDAV